MSGDLCAGETVTGARGERTGLRADVWVWVSESMHRSSKEFKMCQSVSIKGQQGPTLQELVKQHTQQSHTLRVTRSLLSATRPASPVLSTQGWVELETSRCRMHLTEIRLSLDHGTQGGSMKF